MVELLLTQILSTSSERRDLRLQVFLKKCPSFDVLFHSVVNDKYSIFVEALLHLTFRLFYDTLYQGL